MRWFTLAVLCLIATPLPGQEAAPVVPEEEAAYERMLESKRLMAAFLADAAKKVTAQASAEVTSPERWEAVRATRVEELRDMLGLLPWPERTPLNVQITGTLDKGSYLVEKIAFESMPKIYVTANLYIPKQRGAQGRAPAVIYVCGHSYSPFGDKVPYQRHGISLAKNGYVAIILDSIQVAETFAMHHGVYSQEMYDWYSRGYSPAGVEVWNAMRAIDYLQTRPEVDPERIGMTGRSGGAAMSWFTAAVDPRVKVAVPVMGISTYASNIPDGAQHRHCDCMFPVNFHRHDLLHLGAMIAPRPLLMMNGKRDRLFPVEGYEEFERTIGALYRSYGLATGLDFTVSSFGNVVVDTGHEDSQYLREQAIRWFDRHLAKIPERRLDLDYSNAPGEELAVFGGKPPTDAQNYRVHETFTTRRPSPRFPGATQWDQRRGELLVNLRKLLTSGGADTFPLRTAVNKPKNVEDKLPALLWVASDGEDMRYLDLLLNGVGSRVSGVRMVVWPRGTGEIPWTRTFWKQTLREAMTIGETVDSLRLRDVLAAYWQLRALPEVDPDRIMIGGRGVAGALGLYAAILEPGVQQVLLQDPPVSHREGPVFLNVLRHTDLPEAAGLLAPRRLNFYGHMPAEYEYTRHIYSLLGKPDHVFVSMNIEYVLAGRYDHGMASGY